MHIEPTRDQALGFFGAGLEGPVTMLNLLRFREQADYGDAPDLAPDTPASGADAYQRYGQAVTPLVAGVGGEVVLQAVAGPTVIGPHGEDWDAMLLVRYPDVAAFVAMTTSDAYRAISGHRTAALADSRLVATQVG